MLNRIKKLNVFNCIKFIEDEHKYLIDNVPVSCSITKILSNSKAPFDKQKWSLHTANKRGVDQQVILDEWEVSSKFSTQLGTLLHSYIENYWFNKIKIYDKQLIIKKFGEESHTAIRSLLGSFIKSFHSLYKEHQHLTPIRSELIVGDIHNSKVCGTMDLLAFNEETNSFEILDYKTNKKFTQRNLYGEKYTNPVISHLDVCDLNHYSLQQSLYKYIIQTYTDIEIKDCYLIWFDRESSSCEKILCKDYTNLCKDLLQHYSDNLHNTP